MDFYITAHFLSTLAAKDYYIFFTIKHFPPNNDKIFLYYQLLALNSRSIMVYATYEKNF